MRYGFDMVVVGGGIAGLSAALRAAELGLSVGVLEKLSDDRYVCNSRLTGGIFHIALEGLLDAPAEIAQRIERATSGTADPALTQAVANDALRMVRWLQGQGVRFMRSGRDAWQMFTLAPPSLPQFGRRWEGRAGDVMLRLLEERLNAVGGRVLRGHRARELRVQPDGACVGLRGDLADGRAFDVDAGFIVIADGGFQANPQMLERHITPVAGSLCQRNARTGMGDGVSMAIAIGAAITDLTPFYGHLLSRDALHNEMLWPFPWADDLARASIVVDASGRRVADEGQGGVYLANQIAHLPDPAGTTIIFDDATWNGPGTLRAMSPNPFMVRAGGTLHSADSLQELALRSGLPADTLVAEVAAYNRGIETNTLQELAPARSSPKVPARPILRAPFHALPIVPGITYTMGGIRIDGNSRVLSIAGAPIQGLYAAGTATGGLEGGPHFGYVGGLVKSGVTGLRAAEHAAGVKVPQAIPS